MEARLVVNEEFPVGEAGTAHVVVWELPRSLPGSTHRYKYRLAFVDNGAHVLRYDNEAGKGDHRHIGKRQLAYHFVDIDELMMDFWKYIEAWQRTKKGS